MPKIHRLKDGGLFGAAGYLSEAMAVVEWLNQGGDKPKVTADKFHAILIREGALFMLEDNLIPVKHENPFFAVGSGRDFAVAAMFLGKSAAEAVRVAHEFDTDTGPEVMELRAQEPSATTSTFRFDIIRPATHAGNGAS
jgi:hypothetical protein